MTLCALRNGQNLSGILIAGAIFAVGSTAAVAAPIVNYNIQVTGGLGGPVTDNFNVLGTPTGDPQKFAHAGAYLDPTLLGQWTISYNTTSDPDPSVGSGSLSSGLTVENNMADLGPGTNHLQFEITISLAVYPPNLPANFGGNAGMTLNIDPGNSAGVLTTVGNNSLWNAMINGNVVSSLYNAGFILGGSNGPATASTNPGQSLAPFQHGNFVNTVGIKFIFDLTPGETVTFNDFFAFIPSPGALGLLAVAGLFGRRRRA